MGIYLNPGNRGFRTILNEVYVDKTGLIDFINRTINTPRKLTCFSRPRRFGKSFAAKMLCAYYDNSCDSRSLFDGLEISEKASYEDFINKYDVIYLDITRFISTAVSVKAVVGNIQKEVIEELREKYPSHIKKQEEVLADALFSVSHKTGHQFIIIIDECDALFREAKEDTALQKEYIQLLRSLFKGGTATDETIAAAYMTGILPIKKYGTESALTDFREYSMTAPKRLAEYIGFTEDEVKHVYSPNSVMNAIQEEEIQNYWTQTETFESLKEYIEMDFDGLKDAITVMLGGERASVRISTFQNDITSFKDKNDVLTLLIHLGYLAYDSEKREAYIPNFEVAEAFEDVVSGKEWGIDKPAMIIELKYDKDADSAIRQIHEKRYDGDLKKYFGNLLLVGINYDKDAKGANSKKHSCVIERG